MALLLLLCAGVSSAISSAFKHSCKFHYQGVVVGMSRQMQTKTFVPHGLFTRYTSESTAAAAALLLAAVELNAQHTFRGRYVKD